MPPTPIRLLLVAACLSVALGLARADDQAAAANSNEARLRAALQQYAQQAQDAQDQVANLQAAQTQSDQDKAALQAKLDAATAQISAISKQSADDKAASDSTISDLKTQVATQTEQIAKLNDAIASWQKDDTQYRKLDVDKEAARAQLAVQVLTMQRVIDDRETKNLQLYNLGNEILTRYQQYSLGQALEAKEPFTGVARVKLQEAVQDYKDRIADLRVSPGQAPTTPALEPVSPTTGKTSAPVAAGKSTPAAGAPSQHGGGANAAQQAPQGTASAQL